MAFPRFWNNAGSNGNSNNNKTSAAKAGAPGARSSFSAGGSMERSSMKVQPNNSIGGGSAGRTAPTSSGGWFETRQALESEARDAEAMSDRHQCFGVVSLRWGLLGYLLLLIGVICYELVAGFMFLDGTTPGLSEALNTETLSDEERQLIEQIASKQRPWITAQVVWYLISLAFAMFGIGVLAKESYRGFKVLRIWLYCHVFLYFATSLIFVHLSPLATMVPGFMLLSLLMALGNLYAGFLARHYWRKLQAREAHRIATLNQVPVKHIGGPV